MTIGGITGANSGMQSGAGLNSQADPVSKNLQNQIAQAQKELRELSSDENMTAEEKMKKKQEIQQEIANLNQQLRQHQMEQRREQQSAKKAAEGNENAGGAKSGGAKPGRTNPAGKADGLSQASMKSMLSADSSMKQAKVQGGVAAGMEGRAGVLEAEIKQDAGGDTQAKETELAKTRQKALDAEMSQMNSLADASREMKEASETEQGSGESDERKAGRKAGKAEIKAGSRLDAADRDRAESAEVEDKADNADDRTAGHNGYVHVDIRL